jgi:PAP2 superfamily
MRTAGAVLAVLVLLIGFSRIYLGAHYLSDVIGGYAVATVWLTFASSAASETGISFRIRPPRYHWKQDKALKIREYLANGDTKTAQGGVFLVD